MQEITEKRGEEKRENAKEAEQKRLQAKSDQRTGKNKFVSDASLQKASAKILKDFMKEWKIPFNDKNILNALLTGTISKKLSRQRRVKKLEILSVGSAIFHQIVAQPNPEKSRINWPLPSSWSRENLSDYEGECKITTKHGRTYIIEKSAKRLAIALEFQDESIPAYPGFSVLYTADEPNDMKDFQKIPVVGWIKFRNLDRKARFAAWYYWSIPNVATPNMLNLYEGNESNAMTLVIPDGRTIDIFWDRREYGSAEEYQKEHDVARGFNINIA